MTLPAHALSLLYFGKDDAESDIAAGGLLRDSFLETAAYTKAKTGRKRLIIGRKGSGKSAICMRLLAERSNSQSCMICPDEISAEELRRFELQGIGPEQSKAIVWRYIVAVQVAKHIVNHVAEAHPGRATPEVKALRRFLQENGEGDGLALRERFYQIVQRLKGSLSLEAFGVKVAGDLDVDVSEGVQKDRILGIIEERVRRAIAALRCEETHGPLLLLVDQLENVWSNDPSSDDVIVGLLLAVKRLTSGRAAGGFPHVRCVVFLRTEYI